MGVLWRLSDAESRDVRQALRYASGAAPAAMAQRFLALCQSLDSASAIARTVQRRRRAALDRGL
jgi:hypothetical protein